MKFCSCFAPLLQQKIGQTFSSAVLVEAAWPCWTSGAVKEAMSSYRGQLLKAILPLADSSTEPGLSTLHMLPEPKRKS